MALRESFCRDFDEHAEKNRRRRDELILEDQQRIEREMKQDPAFAAAVGSIRSRLPKDPRADLVIRFRKGEREGTSA